jgi:hypothetical protein
MNVCDEVLYSVCIKSNYADFIVVCIHLKTAPYNTNLYKMYMWKFYLKYILIRYVFN